jgi:hypothetical protein
MVGSSVWKRLLLVAVCAFATLAVPALASADVEPNNGITEAEGPLTGGVTYTGTLANSTDLDTYFFYVNGQQQLHIPVTSTGGSGCMRASLGNSNNEFLGGLYLNEDTDEFTYTTPPGVTRYYLELYSSCSPEAKYQFNITPATGIVTGPATLVASPTGEPNENTEQAYGPLIGGVAYSGEIQTQNDEDWFKFYTAPGSQQFDVAFTTTSGECDPEVELKGPGEHDDISNFASLNEWGHFAETSPSAGVYYLRFWRTCVGARYQFVINPPGALTLLAPPPPPPAPAPTPPAPPAPKPSRGYAIFNPDAKVEKGTALLELTCAGAGDCAGTVGLVARANGDSSAKVVIGSGTFALTRGTTTTLGIAISKLGMGMLHLSPNGQMHVHLSGHDLKGGPLLLTATEQPKIHRKRKRHRHHHRRRHRHHRRR